MTTHVATIGISVFYQRQSSTCKLLSKTKRISFDSTELKQDATRHLIEKLTNISFPFRVFDEFTILSFPQSLGTLVQAMKLRIAYFNRNFFHRMSIFFSSCLLSTSFISSSSSSFFEVKMNLRLIFRRHRAKHSFSLHPKGMNYLIEL